MSIWCHLASPWEEKKSLVIFVRDKLYTRLTEMGLFILNRDGSIQGCDPELNKEEASWVAEFSYHSASPLWVHCEQPSPAPVTIPSMCWTASPTTTGQDKPSLLLVAFIRYFYTNRQVINQEVSQLLQLKRTVGHQHLFEASKVLNRKPRKFIPWN